MVSAAAPADQSTARPPSVGTGVTAVAVLMALWCLGFAVLNVVFEVTGTLATGSNAEYAAALTVMNWLVVGLKVVGAAVALLSVARRPLVVSAGVLGVLLWGAFATLGVYALGSVVQAVGMLTGLAGTADQVDAAGVAYVLFFLLAAAGFGALAISHSRRHRLRRGVAVLGALGAPVLLGLLLVAVPALLVAVGLMPSS